MVQFLCQNTTYEQILTIVIVKISISIETLFARISFEQHLFPEGAFLREWFLHRSWQWLGLDSIKDIKKVQFHPACIFVLDKETKSFAAGRRQCAAFLFIINNRINLSAVSPPAIKGLLRPIGGSKCWSGTPWCADNSAKLLNFSARPELFTDVCAGEGSDYSEAAWLRRCVYSAKALALSP